MYVIINASITSSEMKTHEKKHTQSGVPDNLPNLYIFVLALGLKAKTKI